MTRVTIAGVTGTVGSKVLEVIKQFPAKFSLQGVSANANWLKMADICAEFRPPVVALQNIQAANHLKQHLASRMADYSPHIISGANAQAQFGETACEIYVACTAGTIGLEGIAKAIPHIDKLIVANKEPLVIAGDIFMEIAKQNNTEIIPIDSEHNAVMQCLLGQDSKALSKVLLTASGGPFRTWHDIKAINAATVEQALAHPNWKMGRKISVDSATLMNKGLEVIEACILFQLPPSKVDVLVHPQSIVHALVQFGDGSTICQMANPDMIIPIAAAMNWPNRLVTNSDSLDLLQVQKLEFEAVNHQLFPALKLALKCVNSKIGRIVLNASNEVAVQAFLDGKIAFGDIVKTVTTMLDKCNFSQSGSLADILDINQQVRIYAEEFIG